MYMVASIVATKPTMILIDEMVEIDEILDQIAFGQVLATHGTIAELSYQRELIEVEFMKRRELLGRTNTVDRTPSQI